MSKSLEGTLPLKTTPAFIAARSEMLQGFAKLLETGQGSDLTITCKGQTFRAHSAIVASRCHFFEAACWGTFKEAQSHCIDLPDDDPTDVRTMLEYLYNLDYDLKARTEYFDVLSLGKRPRSMADTDKLRTYSSFHLVNNASMYIMGDKYGIFGVKAIASETFAAILKTLHWYGVDKPISNIEVRAFCTIIDHIYNITPESDRGLRDQVLRYTQQYLKDLLPLENFKAVLAENSEFSYELHVEEVESRFLEELVAK